YSLRRFASVWVSLKSQTPVRFLFPVLLSDGSEIVNGKKVPDGKMPYMVSVQNGKGHICGGFLYNEEFVITAAHCDVEFKIKKCKHEDYTKTTSGNDIMLLQLTKKVKLSNKVEQIKLPESGTNVSPNTKCTVAGWGKTKSDGEQVKELQMVEVSVINLNQCRMVWKKYKGNIPNNVVCAGKLSVNRKASFCLQGDSGGPLVCGGMAVGIVSFNYKYNCNYPNLPNVYTDVSKYIDWINKTVKQKKCK
uniref:Peptidase S1 domain-containing protein n=1 Tax=Oryzias sinensis TaxID=183150 RepID=A0A8C7X8U9_9TELE